MNAPLLLDTCAAIWLPEGKLRGQTMTLLRERIDSGEVVYVSAITAWELGMLFARGRLFSPLNPLDYFRRLISFPGIGLAEATPEILIHCSYLPGEPPDDPADRIMAATARERGFTLVTRDAALLRYAKTGNLRALEC